MKNLQPLWAIDNLKKHAKNPVEYRGIVNVEQRKNIERIIDQYTLEKKYGEIIIKFELGKIIYIKVSETIKQITKV